MMDDNDRRMAMIAMAAIGGSIVSLWSLDWKMMSWRELVLTMVVGIAFAIFGVPWIVADLMHVDITPLRVACGVTFFGAAFGIVLIPILRARSMDAAKTLLALKKEGDA
jgi:hypothetical protein